MAKTPSHWGTGTVPEKISPIPREAPHQWSRPETIEETIARFLHAEQQKKSMEGWETPEEADDFDIDDDVDELLDFSPYELPETLSEGIDGYEVEEAWATPEKSENSSQNGSKAASEHDPKEPPESLGE